MRSYNLPAVHNGTDFPTCLPTAQQIQQIFTLFEGSTSFVSESVAFASYIWEKPSCLAALSQITINHKLAPPFPAFPV